MKIYTKTGDTGETSLLGGKRVYKDCVEIDAIGEVDELNSYIGVLIEEVEDEEYLRVRNMLRSVQHNLFTLGSMIAAVQTTLTKVPQLKNGDIVKLEKSIDRMTAELPPLTQFILPGGGETASCAFLCRAVSRRAERRVVELGRDNPLLSPLATRYLNRLSDFLFVLARWFNLKEGIIDVPWEKPRVGEKKRKKA
jgi:cob(I)alamin adenosyltransferase